MAVGADQGGSIRVPSSCCGIIGLKPTFGLVPYTGAMSMMQGIDHLGPMARTVTDAALLLEAIAGEDEGRDPRQPRDLKTEKYSSLLRGDLSGYSFGVLREGFHGVDQEVDETVRHLSDRLKGAGAKVVEVSVPLHSNGGAMHFAYTLHGLQTTYLTDGAVPTGDAYVSPDIVDAMFRGRRTFAADNSPNVKAVLLAAQFVSDNYGHKLFSHTARWIREQARCYDRVLSGGVDFLLLPTLSSRPPRLLPPEASVADLYKHCLATLTNTAPFNSSGHPAISLNCGRTACVHRLPIGAMLVGRRFEDARLLDAAFGVEQLYGGVALAQ